MPSTKQMQKHLDEHSRSYSTEHSRIAALAAIASQVLHLDWKPFTNYQTNKAVKIKEKLVNLLCFNYQ